ncbi:MAG: carbohydrate binding family 9 domain-containing protein [Acidobacteria bacterium]|nr:carbohydrate binding family 9 domain-containing protein [Acidobacteriota bacterium]
MNCGRTAVIALFTALIGAQPVLAAPGSAAGSDAAAAILSGLAIPEPPAVIARNEDGHATIRAVRLSQPLSMDGVLSEEVYQTVAAVTDFLQQVPSEGSPASEKTEAWVLFNDEFIYVAARCWDSAPPSKWVANEYRRDVIRQNDTFGVSFDTFLDRRNGFLFYTNPVGARADYISTDETANFDWNPVWESRVSRFEGGWAVEMQIPFKSLRYGPGKEQVWGIQLRRVIRRKNEWAYLNRVPPSASGPYGFTRISFGGTLVGLEVPGGSKNFEVKPYTIARLTTDRLAEPVISNKPGGDFGMDAKYGLTANLTADFTYNTDFAQVEVDEQQVNLTRFSLQFPEKREFFLEGRGLFEFGRGPGGGSSAPIEPVLFYTRRIGLERVGNSTVSVPLDFGQRLTGKAGRFGIGLLNIQAGEDAKGVVPPTNFTVLRLKRDVLRRSFIGGMLTNRSNSILAGHGSNQAYGVDTMFAFYENLFFSGNYARTRTPGLNDRDSSYQTTLNYTGDRYGLRLDHLFVGDDFNPEVGFLRQKDFRRSYGQARFSPRPRSLESIRKFTWEGSGEFIQNGAGNLETRIRQGRFSTEFENSDVLTVEATNNYEMLVRPFPIARSVTIPAGSYHFSDVLLSYQLGAQRSVSATISGQRGNFYDGTLTAFTFGSARISLTPKLSAEPTISINRVELPHGNFTRKLLRSRVDYAFTPKMFLSGLLQYNSDDRTLSSNFRFRWEYQPGSEFFVVYTDEHDTAAAGFRSLRNRSLVLKINRLFRF